MKKLFAFVMLALTFVSPSFASQYLIKRGDTLSEIAVSNKKTVAKLMELNPQVKDKNLIYAGKYLNLDEDDTTATTAADKKDSEKSEPVAAKKETAKEAQTGDPKKASSEKAVSDKEEKAAATTAAASKDDDSSSWGNWYIAGRAGVAMLDDHTHQFLTGFGPIRSDIVGDRHLVDFGGSYKFALGFDFNPVRLELEYGYAHAFKNTGDWNLNYYGTDFPATWEIRNQVHTIFANVFYDIDLDAAIKPFINAGIGYVNIREYGAITVPGAGLDLGVKSYEQNLGVSVGTGFSWNFSKNLIGEASYRFSDYGHYHSTTPDDTVRRSYDMHELLLGLRYQF